ncbi:MAG: hypothetical protein IPH12_07060 [Saprospirales bacterium]|nr:hypothetical protein [Saprospirales bacterium]MBK8922618.1 hypothetical protein [Saprospirales bacterium]
MAPATSRMAMLEASREKTGIGIAQGLYLKCFYFDAAIQQYPRPLFS